MLQKYGFYYICIAFDLVFPFNLEMASQSQMETGCSENTNLEK